MSKAVVGGLYKHFKYNSHSTYKVESFALNADNPDEDFVIYRNIFDNKIWARKRADFESLVTVNDENLDRFKLLYINTLDNVDWRSS